MNITNLERQHNDITKIMEEMKNHLNKKDQIENISYMATQINLLAGKLRIHLNTEDEHMYPFLLTDGDEKVKEMAQRYMQEMGHIQDEFTQYKNNFNTKTKIENNQLGFREETERIFGILEARVLKEETELYPTIKK